MKRFSLSASPLFAGSAPPALTAAFLAMQTVYTVVPPSFSVFAVLKALLATLFEKPLSLSLIHI